MRDSWKLRSVKQQLIKDLKESTLSFAKLGKRYGVSRQAISEFGQRSGIKRSERPKREHTKNCSICQSIIRIAKKPHSDFISSPTIKRQLKIGSKKWWYHIRILKMKGIVSAKFGRLQSQRAELAYKLYFEKRLPISTIGRQAGLKNFSAAIKVHRALGWDVPSPLFTYDSNDRRNAVANANRKKKDPQRGMHDETDKMGVE